MELKESTRIPESLLIQKIMNGPKKNRGTWVHPQVAINLGQWASPKFAVLVSKWIFEWMRGELGKIYRLPYHVRRFLVNRHKIPPTHFSMLDQMTLKLLGPMEVEGYTLPMKLMPDISLGRIFSSQLRRRGYDLNDRDEFPTYNHIFDDGKRPPVQARLYPNDLITEFNLVVNEWTREKAREYFNTRDLTAIAYLEKIISKLLR